MPENGVAEIRERSTSQLKSERTSLQKALTQARQVDLPAVSPGHELRQDLIATIQKRIENLSEEIERRQNSTEVPGVVDGGWHPKAERKPASVRPGAFAGGAPKLVWHTTEGSSFPASNYPTGGPHFTINPATGKLYQHLPITESAAALENPSGGVETNRAHAIQVEIIGFAGQSGGWSDAAYKHLAELARWIEKHGHVKRQCGVKFTGSGVPPKRLGGPQYVAYEGHLGHQHVPEQPSGHWDPGALDIERII